MVIIAANITKQFLGNNEALTGLKAGVSREIRHSSKKNPAFAYPGLRAWQATAGSCRLHPRAKARGFSDGE